MKREEETSPLSLFERNEEIINKNKYSVKGEA